MNDLVFQGGWYGEAHPNGAYAVVIRDSHIETPRGRVKLCPGGNLLQLRLAKDGIRFAGTGHNDGIAWEWTGDKWEHRGPTFGNSACIYDAADNLVVVATNAEPTWAQGWAFVDDAGQLVPGWVAYSPKDGLSAWMSHGDIAIGQGHDTGGVITSHGSHQIATGQATWVRFNRDGDSLALAWIQEDRNEAHLLWLTVAELLALPAVGSPAPTPTPTPVPVPQPTPEPVHMPFLPPNIKSIRDRYVARFPVPQGQGPEDFDPATGGASGVFENKARVWVRYLAEQIVFETGDTTWGVKNAGGGRPQSKDSITQNGGRLINFDLLTGVGTAKPVLVPEPQGEDITGQTFMPVGAVNHLEVPVPEPTPTPVPDPAPTPTPTPAPAPGMDAELRAFLAELVAANKEQATQIKGLRSDVKKAGAALAALLVKKR